ncbi:hypothetical protein TNIN_202751 [Trichonephila inaurata madagascariensis]|uniref:Uncharacterized protein n=1 Tax=Trichonephila inaurata madagascariensis TaxID=2747483 RepID=A0A8X7CRH4_9ARAC|nr:hypothetical protein TNIN_202751 [Trichonephila inaurata madagascariensis]
MPSKMNQDTTERMILLTWVWFTIQFLFFSYWEILFWPPIILLLHGSRHVNTSHQERIPGDLDPEAIGQTTQEGCKYQDIYTHTASLNRMIQKLMEEEKERVLKKHHEKLGKVKK